MTYRNSVIRMHPVAYWRLGESSGTTAHDEMGTYDGEYTLSPTLGVAGALNGDPDTAVTLARTSTQDIRFPVTPAEALTDTVSFAFWLNTTDKSVLQGIAGDQVSAGSARWRVTLDTSGHVSLVKTGVTAIINSTDLADGAWHHVVLVSQPGTNQSFVYVDGAPAGTGTTGNTTWNTASATARIGSFSGAQYYNGSLDEFAIWDRVLTADEVAMLYAVATGTYETQAKRINKRIIAQRGGKKRSGR